ncbi:hypothetical protein EXS65_02230 [Candidatus Peribacteria bacterium]|nr:hypothetical protein [Candidatus Peribacteria bacterium]
MPSELTFFKRALPHIVGALSLCLIAILLFSLQNPVSLDDGLRHFAMARLMSEQGIAAADWSRFFSHGYFAHHTVDPWFLSNVAFIPFLPLGPILGLKLFALFLILLLLVVFLYACFVFRTPPIVSAVSVGLLLFFDPSFFYRLLLGRPYELITPLAVLIIIAAISKRPFLIGLSLMLCVLLSQIFIFPLLIAFTAVLWRLSLCEWKEARMLLTWVFLGLFAGFFLHPDSLQYAFYIRDTFLRIPLLPGIELGLEMQSGFRLGSRLLVIVGIVTLLHSVLFKEGITLRQYGECGLSFLIFLTLLFITFFLLWARAVDFLWPTLILLLTLLLSVSPGIFSRTMIAILPKKLSGNRRMGFYILLLLLASVVFSMHRTLRASDGDRSLETYTQALRFVPQGAMVLNVDWHFFMPAVLVRPDLRYATGIDPSYTYLDSPKALGLFASLTTPKFQSSPTEEEVRAWLKEILALYPSDYLVFFRGRHETIITKLEKDLKMIDVSGSREVAVFRAKET